MKIELPSGHLARPHLQVIYVWGWQKLRVSLNFMHVNACRGSIGQMEDYLAKGGREDPWINRYHRIHNQLNATKMGLSGQLKVAQQLKKPFLADELTLCIGVIEQFRMEIEQRHRAIINVGNPNQLVLVCKTPSEQLRELIHANQYERRKVLAVKKDLEHRFYHGKGFKATDLEAIKKRIDDRPELYNYLLLLEKASTTS